jgi:glc operon protein GlcG
MKRMLLYAACAMATISASAQMMPNPYGTPVTLDTARKLADAAVAEAQKKGFKMAVAVVDTNGDLVFLEKMDGTQIASIQVSIQKAVSATIYKRPTKKLQDALAAGGVGLRVLRLDRAIPVEGGLPLVSADGKIIGAIGCSGDTSENDGVVCQAGADALNPKPGGQ